MYYIYFSDTKKKIKIFFIFLNKKNKILNSMNTIKMSKQQLNDLAKKLGSRYENLIGAVIKDVEKNETREIKEFAQNQIGWNMEEFLREGVMGITNKIVEEVHSVIENRVLPYIIQNDTKVLTEADYKISFFTLGELDKWMQQVVDENATSPGVWNSLIISISELIPGVLEALITIIPIFKNILRSAINIIQSIVDVIKKTLEKMKSIIVEIGATIKRFFKAVRKMIHFAFLLTPSQHVAASYGLITTVFPDAYAMFELYGLCFSEADFKRCASALHTIAYSNTFKKTIDLFTINVLPQHLGKYDSFKTQLLSMMLSSMATIFEVCASYHHLSKYSANEIAAKFKTLSHHSNDFYACKELGDRLIELVNFNSTNVPGLLFNLFDRLEPLALSVIRDDMIKFELSDEMFKQQDLFQSNIGTAFSSDPSLFRSAYPPPSQKELQLYFDSAVNLISTISRVYPLSDDEMTTQDVIDLMTDNTIALSFQSYFLSKYTIPSPKDSTPASNSLANEVFSRETRTELDNLADKTTSSSNSSSPIGERICEKERPASSNMAIYMVYDKELNSIVWKCYDVQKQLQPPEAEKRKVRIQKGGAYETEAKVFREIKEYIAEGNADQLRVKISNAEALMTSDVKQIFKSLSDVNDTSNTPPEDKAPYSIPGGHPELRLLQMRALGIKAMELLNKNSVDKDSLLSSMHHLRRITNGLLTLHSMKKTYNLQSSAFALTNLSLLSYLALNVVNRNSQTHESEEQIGKSEDSYQQYFETMKNYIIESKDNIMTNINNMVRVREVIDQQNSVQLNHAINRTNTGYRYNNYHISQFTFNNNVDEMRPIIEKMSNESGRQLILLQGTEYQTDFLQLLKYFGFDFPYYIITSNKSLTLEQHLSYFATNRRDRIDMLNEIIGPASKLSSYQFSMIRNNISSNPGEQNQGTIATAMNYVSGFFNYDANQLTVAEFGNKVFEYIERKNPLTASSVPVEILTSISKGELRKLKEFSPRHFSSFSPMSTRIAGREHIMRMMRANVSSFDASKPQDLSLFNIIIPGLKYGVPYANGNLNTPLMVGDQALNITDTERLFFLRNFSAPVSDVDHIERIKSFVSAFKASNSMNEEAITYMDNIVYHLFKDNLLFKAQEAFYPLIPRRNALDVMVAHNQRNLDGEITVHQLNRRLADQYFYENLEAIGSTAKSVTRIVSGWFENVAFMPESGWSDWFRHSVTTPTADWFRSWWDAPPSAETMERRTQALLANIFSYVPANVQYAIQLANIKFESISRFILITSKTTMYSIQAFNFVNYVYETVMDLLSQPLSLFMNTTKTFTVLNVFSILFHLMGSLWFVTLYSGQKLLGLFSRTQRHPRYSYYSVQLPFFTSMWRFQKVIDIVPALGMAASLILVRLAQVTTEYYFQVSVDSTVMSHLMGSLISGSLDALGLIIASGPVYGVLSSALKWLVKGSATSPQNVPKSSASKVIESLAVVVTILAKTSLLITDYVGGIIDVGANRIIRKTADRNRYFIRHMSEIMQFDSEEKWTAVMSIVRKHEGAFSLMTMGHFASPGEYQIVHNIISKTIGNYKNLLTRYLSGAAKLHPFYEGESSIDRLEKYVTLDELNYGTDPPQSAESYIENRDVALTAFADLITQASFNSLFTDDLHFNVFNNRQADFRESIKTKMEKAAGGKFFALG